MNMYKQEISGIEDVLKSHIGEEVVVSYNYTGGAEDDAPGCDAGILAEVGNGYIVLDISEIDYYGHNTTVINLANVTNVYFDKRI